MRWMPLSEGVLNHCLSQQDPNLSALQVIRKFCEEAVRYAGSGCISYDSKQHWFEFSWRSIEDDDDYHALFKIEHEDRLVVFAREPSDEAWRRFRGAQNYLRHKLDRLLRLNVMEQRIVIRARIGSPLAPFEIIAPDSFMPFQITDWATGKAEFEGVSIFSISLCVGDDYVAANITQGPESQANSVRSGTPGRPSSKHHVMAEFERRWKGRECKVSLAQEAEELAKWILTLRPPVPQIGAGAIKNVLRSEWRKMKAIK